MPYGRTSCQAMGTTLLLRKLKKLYAQRSLVDAAIRDLESRRHLASAECTQTQSSLDFSANPCNLTTCRNA